MALRAGIFPWSSWHGALPRQILLRHLPLANLRSARETLREILQRFERFFIMSRQFVPCHCAVSNYCDGKFGALAFERFLHREMRYLGFLSVLLGLYKGVMG